MNNALNKDNQGTYEKLRNNETLWLLLRNTQKFEDIYFGNSFSGRQLIYEQAKKACADWDYAVEVDWCGQLTDAEKRALIAVNRKESGEQWYDVYFKHLNLSLDVKALTHSFWDIYSNHLSKIKNNGRGCQSRKMLVCLDYDDGSCYFEFNGVSFVYGSREELEEERGDIFIGQAFEYQKECIIDVSLDLYALKTLGSPLIESKAFRKKALVDPRNSLFHLKNLFPLSADEWLLYGKHNPRGDAYAAFIKYAEVTPDLIAKFMLASIGVYTASKLDTLIGKISRNQKLKQKLRGVFSVLRFSFPNCFPDKHGNKNEEHVKQVREGLRVALVAAELLPSDWEL